jgi:hypothetical protein
MFDFVKEAFGKLLCAFGYHDPEYLKAMPGYVYIWPPYKCKRKGCDHEIRGMKIPPRPKY